MKRNVEEGLRGFEVTERLLHWGMIKHECLIIPDLNPGPGPASLSLKSAGQAEAGKAGADTAGD